MRQPDFNPVTLLRLAAERLGEAEREALRKGRKGRATWERICAGAVRSFGLSRWAVMASWMTWEGEDAPRPLPEDGFGMFLEFFSCGGGLDPASASAPGWSLERRAGVLGMIRAARAALDRAGELVSLME
jgi:hypothetical protein